MTEVLTIETELAEVSLSLSTASCLRCFRLLRLQAVLFLVFGLEQITPLLFRCERVLLGFLGIKEPLGDTNVCAAIGRGCLSRLR